MQLKFLSNKKYNKYKIKQYFSVIYRRLTKMIY